MVPRRSIYLVLLASVVQVVTRFSDGQEKRGHEEDYFYRIFISSRVLCVLLYYYSGKI